MPEIAEAPAIVTRLTLEADDIVGVTLRGDSCDLPPWDPGAHVDVVLPNGMRRQYSLCGAVDQPNEYTISVDRVADSRGGSEYVHVFLRPGQRVQLGAPRNHFALDAGETAWLFIAGGIGITPFLPLVAQATGTSTPWQLHYAGRSLERMAHLGAVRDFATVYETSTGTRPDLPALIGSLPLGAGVYVCGPERLIDACETAIAPRPELTLHAERFRPRDHNLPDPRPFEVETRRSGVTATVPSERSLLQVLEALGVRIPSGCRTGLCGACEVAVIEGVVEHRDDVLTTAQRDRGTVMLTCVSRAAGERLVIDA